MEPLVLSEHVDVKPIEGWAAFDAEARIEEDWMADTGGVLFTFSDEFNTMCMGFTRGEVRAIRDWLVGFLEGR